MRTMLLVLAAALLVAPPSARAETWKVGGLTVGNVAKGRERCITIKGIGENCGTNRLGAGPTIVGNLVTGTVADPHLGRLVVAFNAGEHARWVRITWAGHTRTYRALHRWGGFAAVLPASLRASDIGIEVRFAQSTSGGRYRPPSKVQRSAAVGARLTDPATGGPVGVLTWVDEEGARCFGAGDLVDDRVGLVANGLFGELTPSRQTGQCSGRPAAPLQFTFVGRPGIRVLAGYARADVALVEVRDAGGAVQRVTPGANAVFGAVVPLGDVVATAVLVDGTRIDVTDFF